MRFGKHIFPVISTVMSYSFMQLLIEISMREDLKLFDILGLPILIPLFIFIWASFALVYIMLTENRKLKKSQEKRNSSYDEESIQEYIKVVGAYLGAEAEEKERNLYRAVASGIYLHTSEKYWPIIDKIDEKIALKHPEEAWKELKIFSKSLMIKEEK